MVSSARALSALGALLISAVACPAAAQPAEPPSASTYVQRVRNGIRLAVARDFDGALLALREAVEQDPSQPHAYYLTAEVHRMRGDLEASLSHFRTAVSIAAQAEDDILHGRSLQGVAQTLEAMEGRLSDARQAWTECAQFADSHRLIANPEVARARVQAIDAQIEQDRAYEAVRTRIAQREQEAQPAP